MSGITPRDIEALSRAMREGGATHLRLTIGTSTVELGDAHGPMLAREGSGPARLPTPVGTETAPSAEPAPATAPAADATAAGESTPFDGHVVTAPNLGTFYRAPTPGAAPYVEVGQRVAATDEVCLIEVMKLYTPVRAGVSGVVREILVQEGDMVEFEQALLVLEADPSL